MMLNRAGFAAAVLALTGAAWAASDQGLKARKPLPKTPTAMLQMPEYATGRIYVKFADAVRVRPDARQNAVTARSNTDTRLINDIVLNTGVTVYPAINHPPEVLAELEARAAAISGNAQPDLAGIMLIEGPVSSVMSAARSFNSLQQVEFVEFEVWNTLPGRGEPMGGGILSAFGSGTPLPAGACCLQDGTCVDGMTEAACDAAGGLFQGDGTACAADTCEGACCVGDNCKIKDDEKDCDASGGVWLGPKTLCDDDPCLKGACCRADFICEDGVTLEQCAALGGVFQGKLTECSTPAFCGACCLDFDGEIVCIDSTTEDICENDPADQPPGLGGTYAGSATTCDDDPCEEEECGGGATGSCFEVAATGDSCCNDENCCELVCDWDPICCDPEIGTWDDWCVEFAHRFCELDPNYPPVVPGDFDATVVAWDAWTLADRCASAFNGSCYEPHFPGGCRAEECCRQVIFLDQDCADVWDDVCVELALLTCGSVGDAGATPDFEPLQGYRTQASYGADLPDELEGWVPLQADGDLFPGYDGTGLNIDGLNELGDVFADDGIDALGLGNLTTGKTIRVAVIEWSFWDDHEDLDVNVEPGQSLIQEPSWLFGTNHATACLGIIGADDNNKGVTGIAPDVELWFFPLVSKEEGKRDGTAWTSAALTLQPGDVISASYGPGGGTLASGEFNWLLLQLVADLGITPCISAGNDCIDLSGTPNLGDSGACIVGACSPGDPFYRLDFSNYYTGGDPTIAGDDGNVVHIAAWGESVATTGYGDLYFANGDVNRTYTASFNGTSAAAPQIAGTIACLQGLAKQFYGIPVPPRVVRSSLWNAAESQGDRNPRLVGGFDPELGCALDRNPDLGPNLIGWIRDEGEPPDVACFPNAEGAGGSLSGGEGSVFGFSGSPYIKDVVVVRGDHVFGNHFCVKSSDDWRLVVESLYTESDWSPSEYTGFGQYNPLVVPEVIEVDYLASGDITDVVAVAELDFDAVRAITIETELAYPGVFTILFVEAYDWLIGDWAFVDVQTIAAGGADGADVLFLSEMSAPQRFVRSSDQRLLIRYWTLGLTGGGGFGGGALSSYRQAIDQIDLDVEEAFGQQLP